MGPRELMGFIMPPKASVLVSTPALRGSSENGGLRLLLFSGHGCGSFWVGAAVDTIPQVRSLRQRGQATCLKSHNSGKARNKTQVV